jgi:hypothetical protein
MAGGDDTTLQCCFCGDEIAPVYPDPVRLEVIGASGETQELYCHLKHLKRRFTPLFRFMCGKINEQGKSFCLRMAALFAAISVSDELPTHGEAEWPGHVFSGRHPKVGTWR